jgi:hypothetical protein
MREHSEVCADGCEGGCACGHGEPCPFHDCRCDSLTEVEPSCLYHRADAWEAATDALRPPGG